MTFTGDVIGGQMIGKISGGDPASRTMSANSSASLAIPVLVVIGEPSF